MLGFLKRSTTPTTSPVPLTARPAEVETRADPNDVWAWAEGLLAPPTACGEEVSPQRALECAAVRNAVDILAGLLGTLPLAVYKPDDAGGTEIVPDHPATPFIAADANPWTSATEFRTALTLDALLHGQGIGLVMRDRTGAPVEILRIPPWACVVTIDPFTQEPRFTIDLGGAVAGEYGFKDVIHVRPTIRVDNLATSGYQNGLAPIKTGRQAIGLALALERHAAQIMGNAGRPAGILSFPAKLGATVAQRIKASWQAATAGRNAGGTAVLEEGGKFQPLAFSSVDNQFLELRQFQIVEIARLFGIPPAFLQEMGRATFDNFEASSREFVKLTLLPWARTWEAALRRTLLSDEDRKAGLSFGFDLDGLLEGDLVARSTAYSTLIACKVMSANEARAKEGLPAYPGGDSFKNPNVEAAAPQAKVSPDETGVDGAR